MSQQEELRKFHRFYILQILVFSAGLARTTAFGYILYKLGASPKDLGLMTAISTAGMVLGYYSISYLHRLFKESNYLYLLTQKITFILSIILMIYMVCCICQNSWGNLWFWTFISTCFSFVISVEQTSRALFVKRSFPGLNYSSIMRQDVLTMGISKVLGFSTGFFIVSQLWVLFFFFLGFVITVVMFFYARQMLRKETIEIKPTKVTIVHYKEMPYKVTVALHMLTYFLLFPINTQVVTYSKIWGLPFYWFFIVSSIGNVFFNLVVNKTVNLNLQKTFIVYIVLLSLGLSLFLVENNLVLLGAFITGGVYSILNTISSARLYETQGNTRHISRFYVLGSLTSIFGAYLFGISLEYFEKNTVFTGMVVFAILAYTSIYFYNKKLSFQRV